RTGGTGGAATRPSAPGTATGPEGPAGCRRAVVRHERPHGDRPGPGHRSRLPLPPGRRHGPLGWPYPWAGRAAVRHAAGERVGALAREYGVDPKTMRRAIERQGVTGHIGAPRRAAGGAEGRRDVSGRTDGGRDRDIATAYASGLTLIGCAGKFGAGRKAVRG